MSAAASAPEVVHIDSDDGDVTTCIDLTGADAFRVGLRSPLGTRRVLVRPEHTVSHLRRVAANLLGLRQTPKLELTKSTNLSDGSTMARLGVRRGTCSQVARMQYHIALCLHRRHISCHHKKQRTSWTFKCPSRGTHVTSLHF